MIFSCTVFAMCRRYKRRGTYKNVVIEETFAVLQCWRSCLVIIWRSYVMTSPTTGPQSWSLAIPDYNSPINISESPQLHADLQLLTTFLAVSKCGSHSTWAKPLYINTHICTVRINTQSNIYLSFHRWRAVGNTVSQSKKKKLEHKASEKEDCKLGERPSWSVIISKVAPNSDTSISVCPSTPSTRRRRAG